MDIFMYTKDTSSVFKAYEVILNNIPYNDFADRLKYLKGMADYCMKNGRVEKALITYQDALMICLEANLEKEYEEIEKILMQVPTDKERISEYFNGKLSEYFKEFKKKKVIDPEFDRDLKCVIRNIEIYFIEPYQKMQKALQDK